MNYYSNILSMEVYIVHFKLAANGYICTIEDFKSISKTN